MAETARVGGEVDAVCTRCKLLLAHTVLAMIGTRIARIRCNTCQGEHAYHPPAGARPKAERRPAPPRAAAGFDEIIQGHDISRPLPYAAAETFVKDDAIQHPAFGLGLVLAVRGERMDVAFRAGVKTLVQGRGAAAGVVKRLGEPPAAREEDIEGGEA